MYRENADLAMLPGSVYLPAYESRHCTLSFADVQILTVAGVVQRRDDPGVFLAPVGVPDSEDCFAH
jgi:hypothetical protein